MSEPQPESQAEVAARPETGGAAAAPQRRRMQPAALPGSATQRRGISVGLPPRRRPASTTFEPESGAAPIPEPAPEAETGPTPDSSPRAPGTPSTSQSAALLTGGPGPEAPVDSSLRSLGTPSTDQQGTPEATEATSAVPEASEALQGTREGRTTPSEALEALEGPTEALEAPELPAGPSAAQKPASSSRGRRKSSGARSAPASASAAPSAPQPTGVAPQPAETAPRVRPATGRPRSAVVPEGRKRSTSLYLTFEMRERLRVRAGSVGISTAEAVMLAIERAYAKLPELLDELRSEEQPDTVSTGFLFPRATPTRRPGQDHKVQVGILMTDQHLEALDGLVAHFGAESRSQLVTAALTDYLDES